MKLCGLLDFVKREVVCAPVITFGWDSPEVAEETDLPDRAPVIFEQDTGLTLAWTRRTLLRVCERTGATVNTVHADVVTTHLERFWREDA